MVYLPAMFARAGFIALLSPVQVKLFQPGSKVMMRPDGGSGFTVAALVVVWASTQ